MAIQAGRLLLIGLVWLGLLWLGMAFAPRPGSADVYVSRWADPTPALPRLPRAEGEPRRHRWWINGQAVQAERRRVALSVRQALDGVAAEMAADPPTDPVFALQRAEGANWGVLMQWRNPQRRDLLGWLPGLLKVAPGGDAYAGAVVVLALEDDGGTQLWTLDFDQTFDPRAWIAPADRDAPGFDLPDLPRFPGSLRRFALADRSAAGQAAMVAYASDAPRSARLAHYTAALTRLGATPLTPAGAEAAGGPRLFRHAGGEYSLWCQDDPTAPGRGLDLLQLRGSEPYE
ncbi:MAG: hypothetical protein RKO24_03615 [Candidatus Competibacter sp.]|nr:hypothetical protein [Candidatus Competibacter sp.]